MFKSVLKQDSYTWREVGQQFRHLYDCVNVGWVGDFWCQNAGVSCLRGVCRLIDERKLVWEIRFYLGLDLHLDWFAEWFSGIAWRLCFFFIFCFCTIFGLVWIGVFHNSRGVSTVCAWVSKSLGVKTLCRKCGSVRFDLDGDVEYGILVNYGLAIFIYSINFSASSYLVSNNYLLDYSLNKNKIL